MCVTGQQLYKQSHAFAPSSNQPLPRIDTIFFYLGHFKVITGRQRGDGVGGDLPFLPGNQKTNVDLFNTEKQGSAPCLQLFWVSIWPPHLTSSGMRHPRTERPMTQAQPLQGIDFNHFYSLEFCHFQVFRGVRFSCHICIYLTLTILNVKELTSFLQSSHSVFPCNSTTNSIHFGWWF